ncbi:MAG: FAD-binding domain-containing protein [Bosea sp. (in: a-proteobacteria)]
MVQVVWFKRDLRTQDHRPLAEAAKHGPVLPLYVVEPDYWRLPDTSARQFRFLSGALADLDASLALIRCGLVIRTGDVIEVLQSIHARHGIDAIWSHEETGNGWTFARDRRVAAFCREADVAWHEFAQFGVKRGRLNRDRWAAHFEKVMAEPLTPRPVTIKPIRDIVSETIPETAAIGLADDALTWLQPSGRAAAKALMDSFYGGRGRGYQREMSSPLTAPDSCSRLSAHLSVGTVSMREAVQRAYRERKQATDVPTEQRAIPLKAIDALVARLHWHCHFIQKLESEPQIEVRAVHRGFEAARIVTPSDDPLLRAWAEGRTGLPFVDACMRSLIATGWINFRMRAMLQSFASYHLALDWRASGEVLARLFTDYEPGIHWPQVQMQSGQTGINTPRIYNPVKQSLDQDPDGVFIRRWLPELACLPIAALHTPWKLDADTLRAAGVVLGETYPAPVINHVDAARAARDRLTTVRRDAGFRQTAKAVYVKHGSRKRQQGDDNPAKARAIKAEKLTATKKQLSFDL